MASFTTWFVISWEQCSMWDVVGWNPVRFPLSSLRGRVPQPAQPLPRVDSFYILLSTGTHLKSLTPVLMALLITSRISDLSSPANLNPLQWRSSFAVRPSPVSLLLLLCGPSMPLSLGCTITPRRSWIRRQSSSPSQHLHLVSKREQSGSQTVLQMLVFLTYASTKSAMSWASYPPPNSHLKAADLWSCSRHTSIPSFPLRRL